MDYFLQFLVAFWQLLCQMAPYLLFGFFLAGILAEIFSPDYVEKHFGKRGITSILKGAILGIPLPICSCGVIPLTASLRKHGACKGATVSFLTATPQTGADSIFATYSMLGLVFAIFRPLAALISGVVSGIVVELLGETNVVTDEADEERSASCCSAGGCSKDSERKQGNAVYRALHYGFVTLLGDIVKTLFVGLLLGTIITVLIPEDWISSTLGHGLLSMLVAMVIGIPLYICSTASIPMALAMMMKGLCPGAALVFLMTGTATNAISVATIWKIIGKKSTVLYLLSIMLTSLALGYVLNHIYTFIPSAASHIHHHEELSLFSQLCGATLGALMLFNACSSLFKKAPAKITQAGTIEFNIKGLSCDKCRQKALAALADLPFSDSVSIDLKTGKTLMTCNKNDIECHDAIIAAVTACGFSIEENQISSV